MTVKTERFAISTKGFTDIIDITSLIQQKLSKIDLNNGIVTIFSAGSTAGITTVEYEPGLIKDLKELFEKITPSNKDYHHNERWHDGNGFSHVRASLLGPSIAVPFANKKLILGTWQQIVFVDFDNCSRQREIVLQFLGE